MLRGSALLALCLPLASPALDLGSLHIVDARMALHSRFVLIAHNRVRSDQDLSRYFQARSGAIGLTQIKGRLNLVTGYYFIDQRRAAVDARDSWHRAFFGPLAVLQPHPGVLLESRTLYERFLSVPGGDFNRFRHRLWIDLPRTPLQPWAQAEALLTRVPSPGGSVANRFTRRYGGGIMLTRGPELRLRVGVEYRQNVAGPGMVNLVSIVEWRRAFAP